jgi:hypothetical protein
LKTAGLFPRSWQDASHRAEVPSVNAPTGQGGPEAKDDDGDEADGWRVQNLLFGYHRRQYLSSLLTKYWQTVSLSAMISIMNVLSAFGMTMRNLTTSSWSLPSS